MADRRSLLRGLAALPAIAAPSMTAAPAPVPIDPIIALRQQWLASRDDYATAEDTIAAEEAAWDRHVDVERRVIASRATSVLGAITALEWAQAEFREHKDGGILGDELILALLASALGVLRRQVA